jgi:hypothetical protein
MGSREVASEKYHKMKFWLAFKEKNRERGMGGGDRGL